MSESATSTDHSPKVIVLERRSMVSHMGGIWCLAIPVAVVCWICLSPDSSSESSPMQLNLGRTHWFNDLPLTSSNPLAPTGSTRDSDSSLQTQTAQTVKPESTKVDPNNVDGLASAFDSKTTPKPTITKLFTKNTSPAAPVPNASVEPQITELPGVVVMNQPRMGLNPVAVFDPKQEAAEEAPPQPGNRTAEAAIAFNTPDGNPAQGQNETQLALDEIRKASEDAREKREREESLKPLIAMHEQAQAKIREAEKREAMKRKAIEDRQQFIDGLNEIIGSDSSIPQQAQKIDLLIQQFSNTPHTSVYQAAINRLENNRRPISRANKIRSLREQGIPEAIILAYMVQLDMKDHRSNAGPRNNNEAFVRSARLLLKNLN